MLGRCAWGIGSAMARGGCRDLGIISAREEEDDEEEERCLARPGREGKVVGG